MEQEDNSKSQSRFNKLSVRVFDGANNQAYYSARNHESALLSPISPMHSKDSTGKSDPKKRGSVDLHDKKKEIQRLINCRPVLPHKQGSISDDDNTSLISSSLSPQSKSKSRRTIDFPSTNLFNNEIVEFYSKYADIITERIERTIPAMITSLKNSMIDCSLSEKEINSLYNFKKQTSNYFQFLVHFMHFNNVREYIKEHEDFMEYLIIDNSSGQETFITKDKLKTSKSLFDNFCIAQIQFLCHEKSQLFYKHAQNLESLLAGSNLLILGAFEVWINSDDKDEELIDNLELIHNTLFNKRSNPMKINLIKTEVDSQKSNKDEHHSETKVEIEKRKDIPINEITPPQGKIQTSLLASIVLTEEYSPTRAVQLDSSPENNFKSPKAEGGSFNNYKSKVMKPLLLDVIIFKLESQRM